MIYSRGTVASAFSSELEGGRSHHGMNLQNASCDGSYDVCMHGRNCKLQGGVSRRCVFVLFVPSGCQEKGHIATVQFMNRLEHSAVHHRPHQTTNTTCLAQQTVRLVWFNRQKILQVEVYPVSSFEWRQGFSGTASLSLLVDMHKRMHPHEHCPSSLASKLAVFGPNFKICMHSRDTRQGE